MEMAAKPVVAVAVALAKAIQAQPSALTVAAPVVVVAVAVEKAEPEALAEEEAAPLIPFTYIIMEQVLFLMIATFLPEHLEQQEVAALVALAVPVLVVAQETPIREVK
ncbi:MAG: hypothetical protein COA57_07035 [Flavobacteriales bacterium]|nr:MAG: hypothetical protein COA57_07035 [Flavobacteriales bacterium]